MVSVFVSVCLSVCVFVPVCVFVQLWNLYEVTMCNVTDQMQPASVCEGAGRGQ